MAVEDRVDRLAQQSNDRRAPREAPAVLLWELVQVGHLAGRHFARVFGSHGLSPAQYGVLASLADGDDLSQAELARAVLVRPQSMARLVSDMVDAGLVSRVGEGGRGRRTGLVLTPAGQAAFSGARPAARATSTPEALGLTAEEGVQLLALLAAVRERLSDDLGRSALDKNGSGGDPPARNATR